MKRRVAIRQLAVLGASAWVVLFPFWWVFQRPHDSHDCARSDCSIFATVEHAIVYVVTNLVLLLLTTRIAIGARTSSLGALLTVGVLIVAARSMEGEVLTFGFAVNAAGLLLLCGEQVLRELRARAVMKRVCRVTRSRRAARTHAREREGPFRGLS